MRYYPTILRSKLQTDSLSRQNGRSNARIVAALVVFLSTASGMQAQDGKVYPGSMCQAIGSSQDLSYGGSGFLISNRTSSLNSAACPLVREKVLQPWLAILVHVRDRHSTQDICCIARARDVNATPGSGWSEEQCTTGEGFQVLTFGPPGMPVPAWGPYALVCQLPAIEANLPSYIASYQIVEPQPFDSSQDN